MYSRKVTKKAIKESIKKWEGILECIEVDRGSDNCPLCYLYNYYNCDGCPVKLYSKNDLCYNTPYIEWFYHIGKYNLSSGALSDLAPIIGHKKATTLVKNEIDYLKKVFKYWQKHYEIEE